MGQVITTYKSVSGVSGRIAELQYPEAIPVEVIDQMLHAEADVIQPKISAEAKAKFTSGYSEGVTANALKRGRPKYYGRGDKKQRELLVTFEGERPNGKSGMKRNAEIAFAQEYGYKHYYWGYDYAHKKPGKTNEPRKFIEGAINAGEEAAFSAAEAIFDKWLENNN